jgi:hypothetical protein
MDPFDLLRARDFQKGGAVLGAAQAMEGKGLFGPAARFYHMAAQLFRTNNPYARSDAERAEDRCCARAKANGEEIGFAFQPRFPEIWEAPQVFVEWYYDQQRGKRYPFPTRAEIAAARAEAEKQRAEAKRQADEKAKQEALRDLQMRSPGLFRERFTALIQAAAEAEDAKDQAFDRAVQLWNRPKNKNEDWGEAWTEFARGSLAELLKSPASPAVQKALRALPRIALAAEKWNVWTGMMQVLGGGVAFLVVLGLLYLVSPGLHPSNVSCGVALLSILTLLLCVVVLAGAAAVVIGLVAILTWSLPRHLKAKKAVEARDIRLIPTKDLFITGGGAPIDETEPEHDSPAKQGQQVTAASPPRQAGVPGPERYHQPPPIKGSRPIAAPTPAPQTSEWTKCVQCGSPILVKTAQANAGCCDPCARRARSTPVRGPERPQQLSSVQESRHRTADRSGQQAPDVERVRCVQCGTPILASTAQTNAGLCRPCRKKSKSAPT